MFADHIKMLSSANCRVLLLCFVAAQLFSEAETRSRSKRDSDEASPKKTRACSELKDAYHKQIPEILSDASSKYCAMGSADLDCMIAKAMLTEYSRKEVHKLMEQFGCFHEDDMEGNDVICLTSVAAPRRATALINKIYGSSDVKFPVKMGKEMENKLTTLFKPYAVEYCKDDELTEE